MKGLNRLLRFVTGSFISATMLLATAAFGAGSAAASGNTGAVYVLTNGSSNAVAIFNRAADGTLSAGGSVGTGGAGTGAGLGSQGAIVLSSNNQWLFAVNAASNEISSFAVQPNGLSLAGKVASGGTTPISLSVYKNVLYVLNAGDPGNITGFSIGKHGDLSPLAGSTQFLSNNGVGAAPAPAEVSFSPRGDLLVVTEKGTSKIDVYPVNEDGIAQAPTTYPSNGATPFGFDFTKRGDLVVSEAGPGALSSYDVSDDELEVVTASATTHQAAPCWVIVTKNGKFAYTTNAHSGNISGFSVGRDGSLTALNPVDGITAVTGGGPLDMGLSVNSQFLYVDNSGTHTINAFAVQSNGSLTPISLSGVTLPAGAVGLAAR